MHHALILFYFSLYLSSFSIKLLFYKKEKLDASNEQHFGPSIKA